MKIEFDPSKSQRNLEERELPFDLANDFGFDGALTWLDLRQNYGEDRWISLGFPGLRPTIGYIDLRHTSPLELVEIICKKLGSRIFVNFLPPDFDLLHKSITPKTKRVKTRTAHDARSFFQALLRMSPEERKLLFQIFLNGCPSELPDNIHIETDLICRISQFSNTKVKNTLKRLGSLGFRVYDSHHLSSSRKKVEVVALEWHNLSIDVDPEEDTNSTLSAYAMIDQITSGRCDKCAWLALDNLDFSFLSSATITTVHLHE